MAVLEGFAKTFIQWLASEAWEEFGYLRNYKRYVEDFENQQRKLSATVESVEKKIKEAGKRNKTKVEPIIKDWLKSSEKLLRQDAEPTKCFGLCTNCFSQIARAKELERLTKQRIPNLIAEVKEFPKEVACEAEAPGMEFHSQEFMSFESRKVNFEELKKDLEDKSNYMIGLQGMGGTGKSAMAIEVGKHVEKSNAFDRVIFVTVSTPVEEKRIRQEIARELGFELGEEKLLTHAQQIWNKIASTGKVLIIVDDVWETLDLKNLGIQPGSHSKGHCSVLMTTRYENVCTKMSCQKRIKLENLPKKDALKLFLFHALEICQDCPDDLKKVAIDIVNECGRLPVIVVAVAKTLKDWPTEEWQDALTILQSSVEPARHGIVGENVMKFDNSLQLSYTHLKNKEAQVLFLLCSIFPKAHEIPVELLSRIAIGLGLFGGVDKYSTTRSQVRMLKNKLLNCSLLLKTANEECVKLHDVLREVAMKIANEDIQMIMDSKTNLKETVKYSSWIANGFPNSIDGSKLEVLLAWINANGSLEVPNAFFGRMQSLRVLLLHSKIEWGRTSALSLPTAIQSLKDLRTLSLKNWELGDISVLMKKLQKLESLELINCSIVEFPNEIIELDKLRFLCLKSCSLEMNNPFEVIARCSQLEELYYVSNHDRIPIDTKVPQITSLPEYQIYHIDGSDFSAFDASQLDTSIKRFFKPGKLQRTFSKEIIKSLSERAEILELEGDNEIGWNSPIPGIVSIVDSAMKDLIKLSLKHWFEMKCLIYTEHPQLKSGVTIFSKLVELQLVEVNVREICCGHYPDDRFLKKLEKLELKKCQMLESTLFKGKLELSNVKTVQIEDCSMTCLFHTSTAQSLRQLETLKIVECSKLKYIIIDEGSSLDEIEDDKDSNPRSNESTFPKLKLLSIQSCDELEFIFPICFCEDLPQLETLEISDCENIRYVFGQYPGVRGSHQMQKEISLPSLKLMTIYENPLFVNIHLECYLPHKSAKYRSDWSKEKYKSPSRSISWSPLCCFLPQLETTNKAELSLCKTAQLDHNASQEKYVGNITRGFFIPQFYSCNLREMNIGDISNLRSLFSVSIASSMLTLEKLEVMSCDELEHIVIEEVNENHHHVNANTIFPNLRTIIIFECDKLEYVFPASCSRNLLHLEYVSISGTSQLKYVFGTSCIDDSAHQNQNIKIDLSTLNKLCFKEVQNMVSMCHENYFVKASSLKDISLDGCPQLPINSFIDLSVEGNKGHEQLSRKKLMGMHLGSLKHLRLESLDMETIHDVQRLEIASPVISSLETLSLISLDKLRNVCVGPKNLPMSFQNLFKLYISKCHNLKFILSASISRRLPYLRYLLLLDCEELERIIEEEEEDEEEEECCFPNLNTIIVDNCKKMKCLFSISTCVSLPQLKSLYIESDPELEQAFEGKHGTTQELDIKLVFPKLVVISLEDLPKLHTICPGIDFQTVICREVQGCPNISLTSTNTKFLDSYYEWLDESEIYKDNMDDLLIEQQFNRVIELAEKTKKRDPPTVEQNNSSTNTKEIAEASDEENLESEDDEVDDSEQTNKLEPFVDPSQIESPQNFEANVGETTNKIAMAIPSITTATSPPLDEIKVTEGDICKPYESKQLEDDDLMKLFQMGDDSADMEGAVEDESEVTKALEDLEATLKMGLNEITSSEEINICFKNALNTLSSRCSDDALKATINSLQQEIQTILSSYKQAHATIDTVNNLEQKENLMIEQRSQRKDAAMTLLSELHKIENSMVEAQTREIELKGKISKLQDECLQRKEAVKAILSETHKSENSMAEIQTGEAELDQQISMLHAELSNKEEEIKVCEIKLLSLQEQKKKIVSDTAGFMKELEAVKKERSQMMEDQMKARHQLENLDSMWSSCLANLKKTALMLGVLLK